MTRRTVIKELKTTFSAKGSSTTEEMAAGVAQGPAGLQTTGVSQGQDLVACGVTGDHSHAVAGTIPPPTLTSININNATTSFS